MTDDPFYAPNHRPSAPAVTPRPREHVWSLRKDGHQVDCELLSPGEHGVEAMLSRDGEWYAGRRFDLRAQALAHADRTRADLERGGWRKFKKCCANYEPTTTIEKEGGYV